MTDTADAGARRSELGAFLKSRQARITPADVGVPPGPRRRTPGLRREEVAQLSGWGCVNAISFDLRVSDRGGHPSVGSVTLSKSESGTCWQRSSGAADGGESDVRRRIG